MPEDAADAVLNKVKHFTIGFGRAGDTPAAKGSGVLIKQGELYGILTCAHVNDHLRELNQPVGLVRLNRGLAGQAGILNMNEVVSYRVGEEPWTAGTLDLAFIHLPAHLVGNIAKDSVFLDIERNYTKPEPDPCSSLVRTHSVFGLVEEFTGATTRDKGMATTALKGVLTPGTLLDLFAVNPTLECFADNFADLPGSFGGTSGGGLWRVYLRQREDGGFEVIHYRLIGIASREEGGPPPRIACQGVGWVDPILQDVRRRMSNDG